MLYKNKSLAVYHETWSGYKMDLVAAFKQSLNVLLLAQKWFKTAGKQTNNQKNPCVCTLRTQTTFLVWSNCLI